MEGTAEVACDVYIIEGLSYNQAKKFFLSISRDKHQTQKLCEAAINDPADA